MLRILGLVLALLIVAPPAHAQLEEQAARQIQLAREDFDQGNHERAVNAASSALRLDPLLYDALVIKALAYEKLNEPMLAYSLLITYQELTRGMSQSPEVEPALQRLQKLIRGVIDQPSPAMVPAPPEAASTEGEPAVRFEILSRRNQRDLFDQMNEVLAAGPAQITFRSQSNSKGDDFLFGLASARWDGDELDLDDRAFTVILDSEKLVLKGKSGSTLNFAEAGAEHDVAVWFDGDRLALRVDGEPLGPFESRSLPHGARWLLQLEDDARAWDLQARPWDGSLASGVPDTGAGASREDTELTFTEHAISGRLDEESDLKDLARRLPDLAGAAVARVRFTVMCTEKTYVIVRPGDGREVTVGRTTDVRGAMRLPRFEAGLQCKGKPEAVELLFHADGGVAGVVGDQQFGPAYPGRKPGGGDRLFRVKGDAGRVHVEGLTYEVGTRKAGRRTFRAGKTE